MKFKVVISTERSEWRNLYKSVSLKEISRLRHFVPTLEMTEKRTLEMTEKRTLEIEFPGILCLRPNRRSINPIIDKKFLILRIMKLEEVIAAQMRQKLRKKLPLWAETQGVEIPSSLSLEQCSGQETALYKAEVALRIAGPGATIADLTGGLGVDSWAFSQKFKTVLYNEALTPLAEAAARNFKALGRNNIIISNQTATPATLETILGTIGPNIIYLDPARRAENGKKVFLLEDCSPDILALKDKLLAASPNLLVKLSPMADITMLLERLGPTCREIIVVCADGECKELLVRMQRDWSGRPTLTIYEDGFTSTFEESPTRPFSFDYGDTVLAPGPEQLTESIGNIIFEPGKSLTKAGLFNLPCRHYFKLGRHTHLYIGKQTGSTEKELLPGKYFRITEAMPLGSSVIKALSKQNLRADVSCHNVPIKSEELRRRLKAQSDPKYHIFAAHADFTQAAPGNYLFITEVLNS